MITLDYTYVRNRIVRKAMVLHNFSLALSLQDQWGFSELGPEIKREEDTCKQLQESYDKLDLCEYFLRCSRVHLAIKYFRCGVADLGTKTDQVMKIASSFDNLREAWRRTEKLRFLEESFSAGMEDQIVTRLLDRLPISDKVLVDIGAGDGHLFSNSRKFVNGGWSGLLIEANPLLYESLANQNKSGLIRCINSYVTPENILEVLAENECPEVIDYLSIDIDSFDLLVLQAVLTKYRPLVLVTEINERVPVGYDYSFPSNSNFQGFDISIIGGASISSMCNMLIEMGFCPVILEFNNLIAVRRDALGYLGVLSIPTVDELYLDGYLLQPARELMFDYNTEIVHRFSPDTRRSTLDTINSDIRANAFRSMVEEIFQFSASI
jgi:hypothetical protein